jgi:hypothetical protein
MAAADITRLMNNARVRLAGATDGLLQIELFNVMDEFFKGSNVWNEDIDIEVPGQDPPNTVYDITASGPALVDKLLWVYTVDPNTPTARGSAIGASMSTPGELTLAQQPSSDVTYRVTVALTVQDPIKRDGYVQFPAWVLAKYRDVILDGLLASMMSQPNKPWTNTQLSVFHMRKFKNKIASARVEWTRNNTYRRQAWVFPSGFSRGSQRGRSSWGGPA